MFHHIAWLQNATLTELYLWILGGCVGSNENKFLINTAVFYTL